MILLAGIPSETPLRLVREALDARGADYRLFNQREAAACDFTFHIDDGGLDGRLTLGSDRIALGDITAVYHRMMDDNRLPEVKPLAPDAPPRRRARALHDALYRWFEVAPARIVNRSDPQGSNMSKPFQGQIVRRHGFDIPETLISNDPDAVRAFHADHGPLIYKSISGVRSIVAELDVTDRDRLERIRWCPVQFQQRVAGTDIRVHVVGEDVHATEIASDGVDYRYASQRGGRTDLSAITLPDEIAERCVAMTAAMGLSLSGIDLRRAPDGRYYCFEVNPSPAFSYYELDTGQQIAASIAALLMAGPPDSPPVRVQNAGSPPASLATAS